MEIRFAIKGKLTKKHYVELYKHTIPGRILWTVLLGLVGALMLAVGILFEEWWRVAVGALELACAVVIFVQPWIQAAKAVKKNRGRAPGMTVFTDVIRDMEDGCVIEWSYSHIWQILTTKHLIALIDGEGIAILMDRDGFTVGSFEEFIPFMRQNCPQLKFPKR